jgi:NADPH2:quinone reductase
LVKQSFPLILFPRNGSPTQSESFHREDTQKEGKDMRSIRAVVVDSSAPGHLMLKEVPVSQAGSGEAIVKVEAISLNRGEVRGAMEADAGWRPGWDLAGTVIAQAIDGTGPKVGSRVVGLVESGAWAEQVAVPTAKLADIPQTVTFAQAATLPVAGLTALLALAKGGLLLEKRVLITGSTGGVGLFAHQIARHTGAFVVGTVRTDERAARVREAGANAVIVGEEIAQASAFGPYHLILDSVGGKTLAQMLALLAPGGTCVTMGYSASPDSAIDVRDLIHTGGTTLYGFFLFDELSRRSTSEHLSRLAQMVASHKLQPPIEIEASWHEIGIVAQRLLQRQFTGKAVLHLSN